MDKVQLFFSLKAQWIGGSEETRKALDAKISQLLSGMTDEETDALAKAIHKETERRAGEFDELMGRLEESRKQPA